MICITFPLNQVAGDILNGMKGDKEVLLKLKEIYFSC